MAKKVKIKVQFDKETMKALKKYAKSHRQTLEKAASSILERQIRKELTEKDTHRWATGRSHFEKCTNCGITKIAAYRSGQLKCKGIPKCEWDFERGIMRVTYSYQDPQNSIHVHRDIPPLVVPMTVTLSWWGRIRAWLRGLPCKQCKGKWNISCKRAVCKLSFKERANPLSDPDQDAL